MKLSNYSGTIESTTAADIVAKTRQELDAMITDTSTPLPRLLRANGNSIHDQALTNNTAVYLGALDHVVEVKPDDEIAVGAAGNVKWATVRVTAWTPWEVVVRAVLRIDDPPDRWKGSWDLDGTGGTHGTPGPDICRWSTAHADRRFVPYVVPSSGRITVGGSLAADTMWRFSSMFGHQARSVVWVDLLTYTKDATGKRVPYVLRLLQPNGKVWDARSTLHQDAAAPVKFAATEAENALQFRAVVGGFGTLGVILQAKLMLLQLSSLAASDFSVPKLKDPTPPPPPNAPPPNAPPPAYERIAPDLTRNDTGDEALPTDEERDILLGRRPIPETTDGLALFSSVGPSYPHASIADLGNVGASLAEKALTWMWVTDEPGVVFDDLLAHHAKHAAKPLVDGFALPRVVDKDTVARFGLFFPNRTDRLVTAVGSVAFGKDLEGRPPFKMWNRSYSYSNLKLVLWALPKHAGFGEKLAYYAIFNGCIKDTADGRYRSNPIPEFSLFMEGHSAKIAEMKDKPQTVQQTWVLPLPADVSTWSDPNVTAPAKALFKKFLAEVRALSTEPKNNTQTKDDNPIRIQVCDVKVLPKGDSILSSASDSPCIAVTLAIEDARDLMAGSSWGSPATRLTKLSHEFWTQHQVKIHLTKNRYVEDADFEAMYGPQRTEFLKVKQVLDPDGVFGSAFSAATL